MIRYARIATPLGPMLATAADAGLTGLYFEGARHAPGVEPDWREDGASEPFARLARQLAEYFAGTRREFDLPLATAGTAFQQRVWRQILRIPYGRTLTYAQLAANAEAARAIRAAGAATGRNPFTLVVPCHRVVGKSGSLTGYAGGIDRKRRLLALEGVDG
jgi:methylated-DNA-[protein]-cysteine S-methyltransferase